MRPSASQRTITQPSAAFSCQLHRCAAPRRHLQVSAQKKGEASQQEDSGAKEQVYIGQGKYVEDDPKKYPSKDEWGTGGWAGGETGLKRWLEESYDQARAIDSKPTGPATKLLGGNDSVYVGQGNYVRDDAAKYPTKDGLSGGFAGGERGVEKYVSDGELEFDESNRPQFSPVTAGLVMAMSAFIISAVWIKFFS